MTAERFDRDELERFLRAVDKHLVAPAKIKVIGGTAASLGYGADETTVDIDLYQSSTPDLQHAASLAREETGLEVPIGNSTVADIPHDAEDRLVRQLPELQKLEVWVLEKHDLVLSKVIRWADTDTRQVRQLENLSYDVLIVRFESEMRHVVGDLRKVKDNFLDMIDDVFGELTTVRARQRLEGWERRPFG
ncbi:MAG TPA: DUF6036 family nucleotidyltransferase [Kofleriaceae bacterium]|jgi:hypothetical protein